MASVRYLIVFFMCFGDVGPALISKGTSVTTLPVREDFYNTVTMPSFTFHGTAYTSIYIQENGALTFDATPFGGVASQYTLDRKWISPYGADIGGGSFGSIWHETFGAADTAVIQFVSTQVDAMFTGSFVPTSVFVVTWENVRLYPVSSNTQESSFQAVLATDSTNSYVLFVYDTLGWTFANVGISAGNSATFHKLCQSETYDAKFLSSSSQTQCTTAGVFVFRVDQSTWQTAGYSCSNMFPSGICPTPSGSTNRDGRCSSSTKKK